MINPFDADPRLAAEWDHSFYGSNENPYPLNTEKWQAYEDRFDALLVEEARRDNQEMQNAY